MLELIPRLPRTVAILLAAMIGSGVAFGQDGEGSAAAETVATEPADNGLSGAEAEPEDFPRAETIFPQLESILVAALSRSPTMLQEDLLRIAARYQEKADRSVLYPRVGGYGYYYLQREERLEADSSSDGSRTYFDFNLSQPLFHWGALTAQAEIGRVERLLAERNFTEAYQVLANRIRDAYLQLVAMRVAKRNRKLELERMEAQLATARARIAEGRAVASAATAIEVSLESLALNHDRAEFALERALGQFRDLVGMPEFSLDDLPETIPGISRPSSDRARPLRTEYVTQRGFENKPAYFRAQSSLAVERLRLRITRTELRPKVNFVTGYTQNQDDRTVANIEKSYMLRTLYAGVRVNWSIWDSKSSQSRARAVQARIRRAERNLEMLEKDLIESIKAAEKEVDFASRSLKIAERGYASAETSYHSAIAFQKEGRSSDEQVDAALFAWRAAESGVCEARRSYLGTVAAFLATIEADPVVENLQAEGRLPR